MRRVTITRLSRPLALLFLLPGLAPVANPATDADPARAVADAYGLADFGTVEEIHYTFNVEFGERRIARSWIWLPHEDVVAFHREDGTPFTYPRAELDENASEEQRQIDHWFINDQYWLLFPFHLMWDEGITIEDRTGTDPSGDGTRHLVVTYPDVGGYTPGDTYELFIDDEDRITWWIYRPGSDPEVSRAATWEDHRRVGPIVISLQHADPDGQFRLWFTDVAVRLVGSEDFISVP